MIPAPKEVSDAAWRLSEVILIETIWVSKADRNTFRVAERTLNRSNLEGLRSNLYK